MLAFIHGRHDEAIVEFERAIGFNPSNISAYTWLSDLYFLTGQEEKAIAVVDKAIRLSPLAFDLPHLLLYKALALVVLGRDAEASSLLGQALALPRTTARFCGIRRPRSPISGATAKRAKSPPVRRAYGNGNGDHRSISSLHYAPTAANIPTMVAYREHMSAGLRKAGMPEE